MKPRFSAMRGEGVIAFTGAKRELLAARFPAEFFDEELGQIAALQERAGALEVERHWSVSPNSERTDDFGFAGLDIVLGHAQAVFLVE